MNHHECYPAKPIVMVYRGGNAEGEAGHAMSLSHNQAGSPVISNHLIDYSECPFAVALRFIRAIS